MDRLRSALPYAGAGVLASLAGMACGHLAASLLVPSSSPVLAVGSEVIDRTPVSLKDWAIRQFGENDKTVLVASVLVVTLLAAAVAGVLARRRPAAGAGLLLVLVALAAAAAVRRPTATAEDLVPSIVAGVVGVGVLAGLTTLLRRAAEHPEGTGAERPATETAPAPSSGPTTRRTVLLASGAVAGLTVLAGWGGQRVTGFRTAPGSVTLPDPRRPLRPLPAGLERRFEGISALRTPVDAFYRVDVNLSLPVVPVDDWSLTVDGDVEHPFTLDFDELTSMRVIERDITLNCVSNEVGGPYIGSARWLGVPLTDLLDRAGVGTDSDQILSAAVDGFTVSTPLEVARDGRDAMVAIGMNGEPLTAEHGFPARLLTPGLYGFVGATKWLTRLTLTRYDDATAYWTERGWATDAPVKVSSRIDTPRALDSLDAGRTVIGGVAWAQHRGIERVEVRIDGSRWRPARLGPAVGVDYWRQWYLPWEAEPGEHRLAVRAVTGDGEVQTSARMTPFPEGSTGVQEIVVTVEG